MHSVTTPGGLRSAAHHFTLQNSQAQYSAIRLGLPMARIEKKMVDRCRKAVIRFQKPLGQNSAE
jgi:hypothetical protein